MKRFVTEMLIHTFFVYKELFITKWKDDENYKCAPKGHA